MKRSPMPRRRRGLAPVSPRRRAMHDSETYVRVAVFARDGRCLLDHAVETGACHGRATFHHLQKASSGGAYTAENGVRLCERHNGWVEDYPPLAKQLGLVVGWDRCTETFVDHDEAARRRARHGLTSRVDRIG